MEERNEWATRARLDHVLVRIEFRRPEDGGLVEWSVSGHSRKMVPPLWYQAYAEDDHRNLPSSIGDVVSDLVHHRPVDPKFFRENRERIVVGWEDPTLPFD